MTKKAISVILMLLGVAGAVLSVGMIISAIRFSEWGRVLLYCVALAVCVELAVLNIQHLKTVKKED